MRKLGQAALVMTSLMALVSIGTAPASARDNATEKRQKKELSIPHCAKKLGTVAIMEPQNQWWREYELGSPEALIRIFVQKSQCFSIVNRGKGLDAMMQERDLASSGELRRGANMGKGQIKAADYILVPDLVTKNSNSGGSNILGGLGGMLGGRTFGALVGGINIKKKAASVVISVTDARSSEEVMMAEGNATKSDLGWGLGGGVFAGGVFGGAGGGSYENSEIGQVIATAYLDAYINMISQMGGMPDNASAANAQQAVSMTKMGKLYASADIKSKVIKTLDPGTLLYPTGNKQDLLWEVEDELGAKGWVSSALFQLAK